MDSSLVPSSCTIVSPAFKQYNRQPFQVIRAQSCRDGRSSNGVDANLRVLRERIEQVKMKEELQKRCRCEYGVGCNCNKLLKRDKQRLELFELLGLVGATIAFTCLTGSLLLCLVSLFVHFHYPFH
ncbi:uncharacterized protein LOC120153960 isoform X2 [Hibiscus syriacus]|uniref:uncharacterized protein LOC120153960 isoform X2 n=1 Tax=Hibiscus syriacus TaxID=106335 RepID=UPI001922066A|nr:uncharacterized protein LOC120153960 isoform X2 [Hibiscus syriacus]